MFCFLKFLRRQGRRIFPKESLYTSFTLFNCYGVENFCLFVEFLDFPFLVDDYQSFIEILRTKNEKKKKTSSRDIFFFAIVPKVAYY